MDKKAINHLIFCEMKTKLTTAALLVILFATNLFAQDRTTVSATNSEISDNLDLRAVASLFGEAENLKDFERQLNDPRIQISNLDLNDDNQVDYLRVIESVAYNTHLIILQSVLGRDTFQDVATIEVEKDRYNQVQVQVVGNVFMYGPNYIYQPVYVYTPLIYTSFWLTNYRPYCSSWYWNYYPTYYYAWNPYPIYSYRNNINVYINYNNQYNYVNHRNSRRAVALYENRRANYYEKQHPNRSFTQRNGNSKNRHDLDQNRNFRNIEKRDDLAYNYPRTTNSRGYSKSNSNATRERETIRKSNSNENSSARNVNQKEMSTRRSSGSVEKNQEKSNRNEKFSSSNQMQQSTEIQKGSNAQRGNYQRENSRPSNLNSEKSNSKNNSRR
jgi:hypothetical protein